MIDFPKLPTVNEEEYESSSDDGIDNLININETIQKKYKNIFEKYKQGSYQDVLTLYCKLEPSQQQEIENYSSLRYETILVKLHEQCSKNFTKVGKAPSVIVTTASSTPSSTPTITPSHTPLPTPSTTPSTTPSHSRRTSIADYNESEIGEPITLAYRINIQNEAKKQRQTIPQQVRPLKCCLIL